MPDLLVNLLKLPALEDTQEFVVRRTQPAAGPVDFYQKTVGAMIIPDSEPGIYIGLLKQ